MIVGYILISTKKQYIGIDMDSGGYPFETDSFGTAKVFEDEQSAKKDAANTWTIKHCHGPFVVAPVRVGT